MNSFQYLRFFFFLNDNQIICWRFFFSIYLQVHKATDVCRLCRWRIASGMGRILWSNHRTILYQSFWSWVFHLLRFFALVLFWTFFSPFFVAQMKNVDKMNAESGFYLQIFFLLLSHMKNQNQHNWKIRGRNGNRFRSKCCGSIYRQRRISLWPNKKFMMWKISDFDWPKMSTICWRRWRPVAVVVSVKIDKCFFLLSWWTQLNRVYSLQLQCIHRAVVRLVCDMIPNC